MHIPFFKSTRDKKLRRVSQMVHDARKMASGKWTSIHKLLNDLGVNLCPPSRGRGKENQANRNELRHDAYFRKLAESGDEAYKHLKTSYHDEKFGEGSFLPDWVIITEEIDKETGDPATYVYLIELDEHRHDSYTILDEQRKATCTMYRCKKKGMHNVTLVRFNTAENVEPHKGQIDNLVSWLNGRMDNPVKGLNVAHLDFPEKHFLVDAYYERLLENEKKDAPSNLNWKNDDDFLKAMYNRVETIPSTKDFFPGR